MQELAEILNGNPQNSIKGLLLKKTPLKIHSIQYYHFQRPVDLFFKYLYCLLKDT